MKSWIEGTVLFGAIRIVRLSEGPCEINVSYQMISTVERWQSIAVSDMRFCLPLI